MGLISFIKNLFKQKEDDLWLEPNSNKKSSIPIAKCDDHIIEVDTLTGEIIIKDYFYHGIEIMELFIFEM